MTDIVKRAEDALIDVTAGPWGAETEAEPEFDDPVVYVTHPETMCDVTTICNLMPSHVASQTQREINARFIAAARQLVPELIAHARAQEKELVRQAALIEELVGAATRFHSACTSAWACGEPSHKVKAMLDAADELEATLAKLKGPTNAG